MTTSTLKYFLQHGFLSKRDALLHLIFPEIIMNKSAKAAFKTIRKVEIKNKSAKTITVNPYQSSHQVTNKIKNLLKTADLSCVIAALVHGSIATDEIIPYSDFDGILIIDENKINSVENLVKLRRLIHDTEKEMLLIDALQHHGWEILFVSEMTKYNDAKIPLTLFLHSKVLYPEKIIDLQLSKINNSDYCETFFSVKESIKRKLIADDYLLNFYSFKNLISEILLIPALYYQALKKEAIFKRESFSWLKDNLSENNLTIYNEVSELRFGWSQIEAEWEKEFKAAKYKILKTISNRFRTKLPERYRNWFSNERKVALLSALKEMEHAIQKPSIH